MVDIVYLLHFDVPLGDVKNPHGYAQHYMGYTNNLPQRLQTHRTQSDTNIVRACNDNGIGFTLAKTWLGDRKLERRMKNRNNHPRYCPICKRNRRLTDAVE